MTLSDLKFPSTRFAGSKVKLIGWIWDCLGDENFKSALEAFGGTGIFSFSAKKRGKKTCFNDLLAFNHNVGLALIENSLIKIDSNELSNILLTE